MLLRSNLFICVLLLLAIANTQENEVSAKKKPNVDIPKWVYGKDKEKDWPKQCKAGSAQSPIDLPASNKIKSRDNGIKVEWDGGIMLEGSNYYQRWLEWKPVERKNAGHIFIGNTKYYLRNITIHRKSEHAVGGSRSQMEIQFLHTTSSKGDAEIAIVSLFVSPKTGKPPAAQRKFWEQLKLSFKFGKNQNQEKDKRTQKKPGKLDLQEFAKSLAACSSNAGRFKKYYNYKGSLAHPPCTKGVKWIILSGSIPATEEFRNFLSEGKNKDTRDNFRTLQKRVKNQWVWTSDEDPEEAEKKRKAKQKREANKKPAKPKAAPKNKSDKEKKPAPAKGGKNPPGGKKNNEDDEDKTLDDEDDKKSSGRKANKDADKDKDKDADKDTKGKDEEDDKDKGKKKGKDENGGDDNGDDNGNKKKKKKDNANDDNGGDDNGGDDNGDNGDDNGGDKKKKNKDEANDDNGGDNERKKENRKKKKGKDDSEDDEDKGKNKGKDEEDSEDDEDKGKKKGKDEKDSEEDDDKGKKGEEEEDSEDNEDKGKDKGKDEKDSDEDDDKEKKGKDDEDKGKDKGKDEKDSEEDDDKGKKGKGKKSTKGKDEKEGDDYYLPEDKEDTPCNHFTVKGCADVKKRCKVENNKCVKKSSAETATSTKRKTANVLANALPSNVQIEKEVEAENHKAKYLKKAAQFDGDYIQDDSFDSDDFDTGADDDFFEVQDAYPPNYSIHISLMILLALLVLFIGAGWYVIRKRNVENLALYERIIDLEEEI